MLQDAPTIVPTTSMSALKNTTSNKRLPMANLHETTFGDLQVDERFRKLQRSLKLAALKQVQSKDVRDRNASTVTTWPSVSSINVDASNFSASLRTSSINSDVLASSNNLRNILLRKKGFNTKQETMTTSSVKQYHVEQADHLDRLAMPPPSTVHRPFKEPQNRMRASSNCEKTTSPLLDRSMQSSSVNTFSLKSAPNWIPTNTSIDKEYAEFVTPINPVHNFQKPERMFLKWKVVLNNQYELIIKGTIDGGKVARSKPVIRRYSARCVESKYKHIYILQGNIVDEKHGLPDYIRGKFYNGFPDDWENIYQIWRTYISQGCPVTFRWPTPVTDSDDDLKSELTDLTYTCIRNKKIIPATKSSNLNESSNTENLNNISKEKEKCNYSAHSSQNYGENTSFMKPFISNLERDVIPVVQAKNTKSLRDEDNKQSIKSDTSPPVRKGNKLKDIFQEDKLKIIINNLADRNCSPKYIDKIIEMFDCLDYIVSYRTESECNNDSVVSASYETSRSEVIVQQNSACNNNLANTCKLENKLTKSKSCMIGHSFDLGYGSIRNDSNAIQFSNPATLIPGADKNSDKSESETYAGVPKISIERVLKARETSKKLNKCKERKKKIYPDDQKHTTNLPYNVKEVKSIDITKNEEIKIFSDESCISITEDEVETVSNTREHHKTIDSKISQEMTFSSHRKTQRNNFDVYGEGRSVTRVQNDQAYVDIISSSTRKTDRNVIESQVELDQDNFSEKPNASPKLHKEFIEQTNSEIAVKKSKPTIISSVPVNLKLRLDRIDSRATAGQLPSKMNNINPTNLTSLTTEQLKNSKPHGVEQNPKVLIAWMPKVVYYAKSKSELGLIFQGKLVNEVGHIVHRKYTTDIVLKRISPMLIETVNHELYELFGNLNDNKHIIPKELLKQCRNGCPAKIEQFCLTWITLHNNVQKVGENLHGTTMDVLNAPISSRGRRILPPLCYWTGERITLKDNNPIYNPGNSRESSLLSLTDTSRKIQKNFTVNTEERQEQKVNSKNTSQKQSVNKQILPESNKTSNTNKTRSRASKKSPEVNTVNNARKYINGKRRLVKKLMFSSTDSSEEEQELSPRKSMRNSQTNENTDPKSRYTLRKRQKIETSNKQNLCNRDTIKSRHYTAHDSPPERSEKQKMTYNYYRGVQQSEDFLSENEVSSV